MKGDDSELIINGRTFTQRLVRVLLETLKNTDMAVALFRHAHDTGNEELYKWTCDCDNELKLSQYKPLETAGKLGNYTPDETRQLVKAAIREISVEKIKDNEYYIKAKRQWYAPYRLLADYKLANIYHGEYSEFMALLEEVNNEHELRIYPSKNDLKQSAIAYPGKFKEWQRLTFRDKDIRTRKAFNQIKAVGDRFREMLLAKRLI